MAVLNDLMLPIRKQLRAVQRDTGSWLTSTSKENQESPVVPTGSTPAKIKGESKGVTTRK